MSVGSHEPSASSGTSAPIQARVLGTFELIVGGRRIDRGAWRRASAARLVKLLLISPGHGLSRERAAETLWPAADQESSRTNLRKALYFARRTLGVPDALASDGEVVRVEMGLVELDLDRLVHAFDVLAQHGALRRSSSSSGLGPLSNLGDRAGEVGPALAAALELGAHTLLPDDPYEDWLAPLREQLRGRWQAVAIEAAREAAAEERRAEAHRILEQILERDPTDEEAHRLSIDLYATEGRYHAVRRQFEECRRALAEDLDASPSAETEAAYRRAELAGHRQPVLPVSPRLVGRRRELGLIGPVLDRVAAGRFAALVIRGPAGIGKTRLLEAIRDQARAAGWRELAWQALESTRSIAFAPFAVRLADEVSASELEGWDEPARSGLAAIVPSLGTVTRLAFADPSALRIAVGAALGRLARRGPRLVAIDDLTLLDQASIELLGSISTVLSVEPVLVAVTYRDEEPLPAPAVELLDILRRSGSLEIRLGPLTERDIEPLVVGHLAGEAVAAPLAAELFARSEGNPLFCLELAREASDRAVICLENGRWTLVPGMSFSQAPETVRHLVATRSDALPATALEVLRVAAELGQPEFAYETLSGVLPHRHRSLMPALDAALSAGLLVERGAGYAFGHPLYRLAVATATGPARRAETHLAIARAIAAIGQRATPEDIASAAARSSDPTPVAQHALRAYELGCTDAATLGVGFGLAAAGRARAVLDRPAATVLFGRTLEVWKALPEDVAVRFGASDAYATLAELRMAEGDDAAADDAFRSAVAAARDARELAIAYERFTWVPYQHGDFEAAIAVAEEGLARLPTEAMAEQAIVRSQLAWIYLRLDRPSATIAAIEDAIPALEAAGEFAYLARALDTLGLAFGIVGRADDGIALLQRALSISLDHHEALPELSNRAHLGEVLTIARRPAEARPHLARALELTDEMGEWYKESVCAWLSADMEDALGHLEAARRMRNRELELLGRSGGNPHNEAFSHAHLAHLARLLGQPEVEEGEGARARELAAADSDPRFLARIEEALSAANWSDVRTH